MNNSGSLKSFVKSSAIFTLSSIFVNLLGYIFHVFAGRYLGPANYSDITTTIAYATIISVPVLVASIIIVKKAGSQHNKALYLRSLLQYFDSFARALSTLTLAYLALTILGYLNHLSLWTILLMPVFVITFVFAQLYSVLLQAGKFFTLLSVAITVAGLLKLAGALLAPFYPFTTPILILLIISNFAQIYLARRFILKHSVRVPSRVESPFTLTSPTLKLTFISVLSLALLNNLDIILAKQFLPPVSAGLYGVWSLFAKAITYTFIPISSVALVFFSDNQDYHNPLHILYPSLAFVFLSGLVAYFGFYLLSGYLITLLMGAKYNELIPLLPLSAISGTVYSLIYLINNYYLSQNSHLAYLPVIITTTIVILLSLLGNNLSTFIHLITWGTGSLLLIYPTTILLRTIRASSRL